MCDDAGAFRYSFETLPQMTHSVVQRLVAAGIVFGIGACEPAAWHPAEALPYAPSALHGDLHCSPGEADCNPCAESIPAQFAGHRWQGGDTEWHFFPQQHYRGYQPDEAYDAGLADHVQGFVRLNGPGIRYAMLHSGGRSRRRGRFASLSLIAQQPDGSYWLTDLRKIDALHAHTSGLFTLGRYVGLFNRESRLALLEVEHGLGGDLAEYPLPFSDSRGLGLSPRSGGVAMARLAEGGYLLVANEGGAGPSSGHSHFFRVLGDLSNLAGGAAQHPLSIQWLGDFEYPAQPAGPTDYHHSENLALLTECGTGDLFTVHVGSSRALHRTQSARTFWRVSRVVFSAQGPVLDPVGAFTRTSTLQRCFGRAAGSAFVQADRRIDVQCHQRSTPDDDGVWNFWHHLSTAPLIPAAAPSPGVPTRPSLDSP